MFTKLELREILRCVSRDIDEDVLAKIQRLINGGKTIAIDPSLLHDTPIQQMINQRLKPTYDELQAIAAVSEGPPQVVKIVWTPELAARYKKSSDWDLTPEDVAAINEQHQTASDREWYAARDYVPVLSSAGAGVHLAAFVDPDRPRAPGYQAAFEVGQKNAGGDACVRAGAYQEAAFKCKDGHGYTLNGVLAGCPQCWAGGEGGRSRQEEDPDNIPGYEAF